MAIFVADASVALAWCFEDGTTEWTESLLDRLGAGDRVAVPAHWPTEITNGLLVAVRRQRILASRADAFWEELGMLPIDVEPAIAAKQARAVLALSHNYSLTAYDAAYLELALRRSLPLATLDRELSAAVERAGIPGLFPPPHSSVEPSRDQ